MSAPSLQRQLADAQSTANTLREELAQTHRGLLALAMELEERVDERTAELRKTNLQLQAEIAERQRAEKQLGLQATALQSTANAIVITRLNGTIQWVNQAFTRLTGYSASEAIGQNPRLLKSGRHDVSLYKEMWKTIRAGKVWQGDLVNKRKDGSFYSEEMTITPVIDALGGITHFVAIKQDVTERKRAETRIRLLAETASELLRIDNPQREVESLCREVMEFLDCHIFLNYLVDEKASRLHLNACAGIPPEEAKKIERLDFGEAVCGCAARDGCRIIIDNILDTPDPRSELIKTYGIQAYACHPLKVQNRVLGTLSFGTRSRKCFNEEELALMKAVADQVAIAIERQRAQAESQRMNAELEQRVQERTAKLQDAVNELEHFSYTITHDMRAPLRAMRGYSDMLLEAGAVSDPSQKAYLKRIAASAARMDQLITDALNYSKLVQQEMELVPVDVNELLQDMVESYPNLQQVKAQIHIAEAMPPVLGNGAAMMQCFSNLLNNAIKFVQPDKVPEIRVWAEEKGDYARFWVKDSGIGIPADCLEKVFGMFQRLSNKHEGTGIGLALVRKAAERMGGKVGVESELGKGSRFWLEFKKAAPKTN